MWFDCVQTVNDAPGRAGEASGSLNHHLGIRQQVLHVDRSEVALAGPEHEDSIRTSSTRPAPSTWPPTSLAAASTTRSPASSCAVATDASTPSAK